MHYSSINDQPTKEDFFEISSYIQGLQNFIKECTTPMTLSIQGDWGTGKTSIMKQLEHIFEKECVKTVFLNTWQYSQFKMDEDLSLHIILELINSLVKDNEELTNNTKNVVQAGLKLLKFINVPMLNTERIGESLDDIWDKFEKKSKTVIELKEKFEQLISEVIDLEKNEKIIVFIDDLDRLSPKKAVELLEVIKLFLDCKGCVFILAIDYSVVLEGLTEKYGSDFDKQKSRAFFDKIIQVPFNVPVSNYNMDNYIKTSLEKISVKVGKNDLELIYELIKYSIGMNPRSIKRLLNTFSLLIKIYSVTKSKSKNNLCLLAILCMEMKFEEIYLFMLNNLFELDDIDEFEDFFVKVKEAFSECEDFEKFFEIFLKVFDTKRSSKINKSKNDLLPYFQVSSITSSSNKQVQNHSVNSDVQYIMRKLFNVWTEKEQFNLENIKEFGNEKEREAEGNFLDGKVKKIRLTKGKGQGLNLYLDEKEEAVIYFSGDYNGKLVNSGIDLFVSRVRQKGFSSSRYSSFSAYETKKDENKFLKIEKKLKNDIEELVKYYNK